MNTTVDNRQLVNYVIHQSGVALESIARAGGKEQGEWHLHRGLLMRIEQNTSPMRLLEMLVDRFGIFETAARTTITLARLDLEGEADLPMQGQVAEAVLEFGDDLRAAFSAAREWARNHDLVPFRSSADEE